MKKKKKSKVGKRAGGFDRSRLNPMFMANAKTKKDDTQGWAFDFDNPEAGNTEDDAIMKQVMAESLKDSNP